LLHHLASFWSRHGPVFPCGRVAGSLRRVSGVGSLLLPQRDTWIQAGFIPPNTMTFRCWMEAALCTRNYTCTHIHNTNGGTAQVDTRTPTHQGHQGMQTYRDAGQKRRQGQEAGTAPAHVRSPQPPEFSLPPTGLVQGKWGWKKAVHHRLG
jgi:hypothetical protein